METPWTLLYADDIMLACEDKTGLERQAQAGCDRLALFGPKLNVKKTDYMTTDILEVLGTGAFGAVFRVRRLNDDKELAMKCESCKAVKQILKHEAKVFESLRHLQSPHFITLQDRGKVADRFIFVILKLLTKKQPQAYVRVAKMNIIMRTSTIQIVERTEDKDLRNQRVKVAFRGTTRYSSISALQLKEQSRKDDLEAWWYMVLEWMTGELPWKHVKGNREEVLRRKKELRKEENLKEALKETPHEYMAGIILYIDTLDYASIPDYDYIAAQLDASMEAYHLRYADPPDWDLMATYLGPRYEKHPTYPAR
ncbi:unnamed protein product [Heligmosomoides polygyrus]|uniref:Protein kinase domain-containing protein n=1 Tax=Heligmosomoides polygyrus TaxID=6339 RepID=A0A3P7X392_HELPZ|nr:unnamed protein product [Heligmosomoides polygyrus]